MWNRYCSEVQSDHNFWWDLLGSNEPLRLLDATPLHLNLMPVERQAHGPFYLLCTHNWFSELQNARNLNAFNKLQGTMPEKAASSTYKIILHFKSRVETK